MNRRRFLTVTAAAGAVGLAGCPTRDADHVERPSQTTTTSRSESAVVDTSRMTEVSADVSASDDVSDIVGDVSSGELLVFPPGEFTWQSEATVTTDDWGIRCHSDTVFQVPEGVGDGVKFPLLATSTDGSTADNFLLDGLTFDSAGRAAPGVHLGVRNTAHVQGLNYRMNGPVSDRQQENGLHAHVEDDDGRLLVAGYWQHNNGDLGAYGDGDSRIGVWVGPKNNGTVHLRNPILQGFPNNACYVSRQPGTVIVEGGFLVNNNVSGVRVGGGVEVHGTTIVIDTDQYLAGEGQIEASSHITRGVWGDNRGAGSTGGLVTDCTFVLRSYQRCHGLATILENPRMTIRDSEFLLDSDIVSVQVDAGQMHITNCDFRGSSRESTAGVGKITGSDNYVKPWIDAGDVPVER